MDVASNQPTLAGAIMRSRVAREKQQARRRRRRLGLAAGGALVLAAGTAVTVGGMAGSDPVMAAVAKVQSLADLINQRSPGQRTEGVLTKTKRAQHSLAKVRAPLVHAPAPSATALAKILLPAAEAPIPVVLDAPTPFAQVVEPPLLAEILVPTSAGGSPPIVGAPGGGGSTPGGGTPPIVTPTPNDIVPTPAVPEPATWAMMLLGFGFIGWRARRDKAVLGVA